MIFSCFFDKIKGMKCIVDFASFIKNSPFFTKKLFISYNLVAALFLILTVWLYGISTEQVKRGVNENNLQTLSASVDRLDNTFETINAVASQLLSNQQLMELSSYTVSNRNNNFYRTAYDVQRSLQNMLSIRYSLPVSNSFLYMRNNDYFISPTSFSQFQFYYDTVLGYPEAFRQDLIDALINPDCWWRLMPVTGCPAGNYKFLYLHPLQNRSLNAQDPSVPLLCHEFSSASLSSVFSDINLYESGCILAANRNGSLVFPLLAGDDFAPDNDFYTRILTLNLDSGQIDNFYEGSFGEKLLVTKQTSSYNNWSYYLVQPYNRAYLSVTYYQFSFVLLVILFFVTCILLTVFLSIHNSKPVKKIHDELSSERARSLSLTSLVEKSKPVVTEVYIRRIVEGSLHTPEELADMVQSLGLDRPDMQYQVLYVEVYPAAQAPGKEVSSITKEQSLLVRNALKRHFPDTGYIFKPAANVFVTLVASLKGMDNAQLALQNRQTFEEMHRELLQQYELWSSGGFSLCAQDVCDVWHYLESAKNAKSIATEHKYVICDGDYNGTDDVYYYPETIALQLSGFISTGNKEKVKEVFSLLEEENMLNRALSPTQQQYLLSDVRNTLFKNRHQLDSLQIAPEKQSELDNIDKQFRKENSFMGLRTIALQLCDCHNTAGPSPNIRIAKIKDHINSNYNDPNLCLKKISDQFHISENYFSFLFKKETNENFSVYLEKLRMAKAKELIVGTDTSLSTLFEQVGYNNATSFTRAFKKTYGVSPKKMRDSRSM